MNDPDNVINTYAIPRIFSDRLVTVVPEPSAAFSVTKYFERNKERFSFVSSRNFDELSVSGIEYHLRSSLAECLSNTSVRFFSFLKGQEKSIPIGDVSFTRINGYPFYTCFVGFRVDKDFEGMGYAFESVSSSIQYMFLKKKIHRITALSHPENVRSKMLLAKLGFQVEGFFKNYILLNGRWCDQVVSGLINNNWMEDRDVGT